MPANLQPSPTISDTVFSEVITLRDAYSLMEIFVQDYIRRGDTPVSDFLYCYAEMQSDGKASDPASLPDFLAAWQKLTLAQRDRPITEEQANKPTAVIDDTAPGHEGRWLHQDEDTDAEYIIEKREGVLAVTARCISDGELMEVRALRWEQDALRFDTVVPSSGYRTRHSMRFTALDRCDHEFTLFETWKRVQGNAPRNQEAEQGVTPTAHYRPL